MLLEPFPKFHDHAVGEPVDVSVKVTLSGATPDRVLAVKEEVGEPGAT